MSKESANQIRMLVNPQAADPALRYEQLEHAALTAYGFKTANAEISTWPGYRPTSLVQLPSLAAQLGVGALFYKDERSRFDLKSFKALGGAYAVLRVLQAQLAADAPEREVSTADLLAGRFAAETAAITVTCATDGNHGRSVAWGAQMFGCRCVIFVHETVSQSRCEAIEQFGAQVRRVAGNYDASVRHAAEMAASQHWTVVSDTSYDGYRDIPLDVMHGYGVLADEIIQQLDTIVPTHVLLQAGVGAMAASVCASFWLQWQQSRPTIIVIEPSAADCCYQSALAGHPVAVDGDLDTIMAGLSCGEVSMLAWPILNAGANVFMTIDDDLARQAVRRLANPAGGDAPIVAGETGACGLGALLAARQDPSLASDLGLNEQSCVLLIGSEGDTDANIYTSIVGRSAAQVLQ